MFLLGLLLLAGCSTAVPAETPPAPQPSLIPSITVPPLPSPTSWSTRTPSPTDTPTPTPLVCWQKGGTLEEENIYSEVLGQSVDLLIYLPPCYHQLTDLSFPALYLIHGQGYTKDQWVRLGLVTLIDAWVADGESPPAVVVMPQVSDWSEPDSFPFGQALVEDVIPALEQSYRLIPTREARKVGGISRGASWALHLGLKYWQTFSAFGAHSLPVFFDDAPSLPYWLDAIPLEMRPQIYLDHAQSDQKAIRRSTSKFIDLLDERHYPYQFYTAPGIHDEVYWGAHLGDYLRFYLDGW
jgi:enterochelin esterase-like enzyme